MSPRRVHRQRTRPTHERWLVSYADFITLLFAFFVVLYASAQSDQKRAAKISNAIEQAFEQLGMGTSDRGTKPLSSRPAFPEIHATGTPASTPVRPTSPFSASPTLSAPEMSAISTEMQQALPLEIGRHEVSLRTSPDGLVVSLQELGFFDSGSDALRPSSQEAFGRIAAVLRARHCKVRIEGHTDPVPIHTPQFASNWELSTARATGLVRKLIQEYAMDPADLAAGGYAEYHPIASNHTSEGRRLNRRVDLVILSSAESAPPGDRHLR